MTSQALSEGRESNQVEAEIAALLEMGSVPTETFRQIEPTFQTLDNPVPPRRQKLRVVFTLAALSALLAACAGKSLVPEAYGEPQAFKDQRLEQSLPPAGEMAAGEVVGSRGVPAVAEINQEQKNYLPAEFNGGWSQYAMVEAGDAGVLAALARAAGADPQEFPNVPEGYVQAIVIYHGDQVEVYDWQHLLADSPTVYVGDQIVHRFYTFADLEAFEESQHVSEENIHLSK